MENGEIQKDKSGEMNESECSTIPTDLTVSVGSEPNQYSTIHKLDRKNWIQESHMLKLELSRKNLLVQNLKADFMSKVEELEEKLVDALHQKEMVTIRLESQMEIKEEDWKKKEKRLQTELHSVTQKLQNLEETTNRFNNDIEYLKNNLNETLLNTNRLPLELKQKDLSFKEKILMQCYEFVLPYKAQKKELEEELVIIRKQFHEHKEKLKEQKEESRMYHQEYMDIQEKYLQVVQELSDTKNQIQYGNYAQENFSRVKEERDKLQAEVLALKENFSTVQAKNIALLREKDDLKTDILNLRHQQALLMQERKHFGKQLAEVTQQWGEAQDRISQLKMQLDYTKEARETVFNQFITARDQFKTEYSEKLRYEMDQIRNNTNQEMEKLKNQMNLFYEKEIRSLQEAHNATLKQKKEIEVSLEKATVKCEKVSSELQQSLLQGKNTTLELQTAIKQKNYEFDKLLEIQKEAAVKFEEQKLENEKLSTKLEAVNIELQLLQQKQALMDNELADKVDQLQKYKKLEKDLESISVQTSKNGAEIDQALEHQAEKLIFPISSLEKLQHNINLLHKIMDLEKRLSLLQQELNEEKEKKEKLDKELSVANSLLNFTKKPHSFVMNAVKEKEIKIQELYQEQSSLKQQFDVLSEEYYKLLNSHKSLADEMEKIIKNREELMKVKQLLITLHRKQEGVPDQPKKVIKIALPDHASFQNVEF